MKYEKDFEAHFMSGFPYNLDISVSADKKDKGRNKSVLPQEKVGISAMIT